MPDIDDLLLLRNSKRAGTEGNVALAKGRLGHSKFIASNFVHYDQLRRHLFHSHQHKYVENSSKVKCVIDYLKAQDWITPTGRNSWTISAKSDVRTYLSGGWLEELIYFAHREAGVDEAYFAQDIEWRVKDIIGKNEIDVIARRGDVLSFTSCKTLRTEHRPNHSSHLRRFLSEADYWDTHFANDMGRALLVTTADFVDELHNDRDRYPQLLARASILDVAVIGIEALQWDRLIETLDRHWENPSTD